MHNFFLLIFTFSFTSLISACIPLSSRATLSRDFSHLSLLHVVGFFPCIFLYFFPLLGLGCTGLFVKPLNSRILPFLSSQESFLVLFILFCVLFNFYFPTRPWTFLCALKAVQSCPSVKLSSICRHGILLQICFVCFSLCPGS